MSSKFAADFLTTDQASRDAYRAWMSKAFELLCERLPTEAYSGKSPAALSDVIDGEVFPQQPLPIQEILRDLSTIISQSIILTHPNAIAHLHPPPLIPGLAAELVTSALNQSMDSFDQAPIGTILEEKVVKWLCDEVGLGSDAAGIFTSGGTQSNYMGLLLARDACIDRHFHWSVQKQGLPEQAKKLRILCSDVAHFTVEKSAAQLGLGTDAVVRVQTDDQFRMRPDALRSALRKLETQELIPMAIVATAGTTDFGSIDPLPEIAALAKSVSAWFHVDAAYGSALLFSIQHRKQLAGIDLADSLSMDFHKLLWQPISCAAFLLRDSSAFRYLALHADYLNPELHEELGIPNLVTRSVATTRRFDALKLWISLKALGRKKLGEMIDATIDLAAHAARIIRSNPRFELLHEPSLGCVVFRYLPAKAQLNPDFFNAKLRQQLFERGIVIGHTIVRGQQCLKLTCMNPAVSKGQIGELITQVATHANKLEQLG